MAIRSRYYQEFNSRSGDKYKITIWDLDHQSNSIDQSNTWGWQSSSDNDAKEIDIVYDSVEIKWDGDNQKVHQPIIGSMLTFSMLATTDDHMGLVKALKHSTEFRVGVKVERLNFTSDTYEPYWYGVILPEAVVYDYSDLPCKIDIRATDGLSTLRDKPYINTDETLYSGHAPAQVQIGNCFKHLPHLGLWGPQDNFFFECVDLFHESHATLDDDDEITSISSILDNVGCNVDIWYEERDVDPPFFRDTDIRTTGASSYDVIANWMTTMGLRLCHVNGAFLAVSPFSDRVNINSRLYKYDKRTMVNPSFQYSNPVLQDSNTALLPDTLDLREKSQILTGSTRSFLHPLRAIYYKHNQGGAARLFPEVKWVNVEGDFAQDDINVNLLGQQFEVSQNFNVSFPLNASQAVVPTAIPLRMVGILQHWYRPADTSNEDTAIGAQFEVRMKIKVGSYYLKQTVGIESTDNIDYSTGFGDITKTGADIISWKPIVINSDVEWTTNSNDRFSFPAFLKGQTTPDCDLMQYDNGDGTIVEYYPGFGCRRHPSKPDEQKYDSTSRGMWKQAYETELDFTLPELPNSNVSEQGVEITVEIIKYKNDTNTTTTTSEVYPTNPIRPNGARIIGFNMYVGDGTDDGDAFYYSELDEPNGREMVVGGETLVASRVVEDYGEIGAITANTNYTHKWHSENNFVYGSGRRNLQVLAEEHIRIRGEARDMYNLRFIIDEENTAFVHPLHTIQFQHENSFLLLRPLSMSYALSEAVLSVEAFQTGRNGGIIYSVNDANKSKGGVGTNGVGGGGISGTRPLNTVRSTFGSSDPGITSTQTTKLAGIEANATANETDAHLKNRDNHTGTQTADTISDFSSAVTSVQAVQDNSAKTSFPGFGTGAGTALEGNTNTIGDISGLGTPLRSDGGGSVIDAINDHPNQLTFVVDSTIPNQTGSKKFTVQDFYTAIVQAGLEDLDNGGFVDIADYVGTTSGVVGDFNDDGSVGSADLIEFLILFGTTHEGNNGAFGVAKVEIQSNTQTVSFPNTDVRTLTWSQSAIPSNLVNPSGVSINILDSSDEIEFVSGSNAQFPISAWTQKRVTISEAGTASQNLNFGGMSATFPSTQLHIGVEIKALDSDDNVVVNTVELLGTVTVGAPGASVGIAFSSLTGANRFVTTTDLSDPTIAKIRVKLNAQPVNGGDTQCVFTLTNVKIALETIAG